MVRKKTTPEGCRGHRNGMTVKLKSGETRLRKPNKRALGPEEERDTTEVEEPGVKGGGEDLPETPDGGPQKVPTPQQPSAGQQDQHHFLRSSVRPHSKRIRRDFCGTSTKSKGVHNAIPSPPSCSSRVATSAPKTSGRNVVPPAGEKDEGSTKKVRRQWESWSTEDKNTFFEALFEHGKDFEAIQNNIALKYKKKSKPTSMVKNKEQVRHFYYRTWHKISKYIDFSNVFSRNLKKSSQELYGLICYGELRKKIGGCLGDKNAAKLNELIQLGATTVRHKGRNLRIKAPMCRALKKLCEPEGKTGVSDEEDLKPVRLPLKLPVELQPRNNQAWARVQSLAQNPRLRMIVELHRKVSSLIEFLQQKWVLHEVRIRKSLEDHQQAELGPQEPEDELVLFPVESAALSPLPGVARVVHSKAYCTVHWQETGKCKQGVKDIHLLPPAQILGTQTRQGTTKVQQKCPRGGTDSKQGGKVDDAIDDSTAGTPTAENGCMDSVPSEGVTDGPRTPDRSPPELANSPAETICEASGSQPPAVEGPSLMDPSPTSLNSSQDPIVPEESICTDSASASSPKSPEALPTTSGEVPPGQGHTDLQTENVQPEPCTTETSGTATQEKEPTGSSKAPCDDSNQLIEQVRQKGWNQQTSENLTLAEVYLMLGKPGKLQLEYEWLAPPSPDDSSSPLQHKQRLLNCLLRLISTEVNPKTPSQGPETTSVATSPLKLPQEQVLTPSHKVIALLSRNPECLSAQPVTHIHTNFSTASSTSAFGSLSGPLLVGRPLGPVTSSSDGAIFAVPTMLPPNSRHSKVSAPSKESEMASRQQLGAMGPELYLPKTKKQRSRQLRKPLVVQRTLLPRPSGSTSPHMCSFSIFPNSSVAGRGSFRPIHSALSNATIAQPIVSKAIPSPADNSLSGAIDLAAKTAGIIPGHSLNELGTNGFTGIGPINPDGLSGAAQESSSNSTSGDAIQVTVCPQDPIPFMALSSSNVQGPIPPFQNSLYSVTANSSNCAPNSSTSCLSPPNVSSLLDISLPGPPDDVLSQGDSVTHISDSIIEIAISSGQYGEAASLSPAKLNDNSKSLPFPSSFPQPNWIASPSHDPQWYPNDSTDSSLSSLFSSFISPDKSKKTLPASAGGASETSLLDASSRDSFVSRSMSDVAEVVDSHLACLMNENSIDYISRFNDLAQELSSTDPVRKEPPFEAGIATSGQPISDST
ncbi:protein cramped-like [Spea bombifrons]|uniref:protein cramped-like n=1 Tax=Spea bombifrons TaxID=233779 RepID=UPI00234980DC|nr:protein cramped-like [Spea bombifrons]